MKQQPQLLSMIKGQMFDGYLLVRTATQRTSQNGNKYLDMTLCDISGDVNAKMWDALTPPPTVAQPVRVRAMMQEYNGRAQLRVDKMRPVTDADDIDMGALTPVAPEPAEDMRKFVDVRVARIADESLKVLVQKRLDESGAPLSYYPAASKLHHAEKSGLLHHMTTMLRTADAICAIYPQLDADLLAAGVVLHDLCKITELASDELGMVSDYTREGMLVGHLVMGVAELRRAGRELGVRDELLDMLEHMILSHHDLPEYGSPKPPMFPEAEVLHLVDQLDARMFEMQRALAAVQPGTFTERIWSLDRKLYRRTEDNAKS